MILSTLFEFGKTFALGLLLNDYFIRNYPNEHNRFLIDIACNIIYSYSYFQIMFNNLIKYIPNISYFLENTFKLNIENMSTIHFVKNNSDVLVTPFLNKLDFKFPEHDFVLYRDGESKPNNIKIIHSNDVLNDYFKYEKSTIKFMLIEFKIDNNIYLIDLSNNNYNFYIKDNIFDKQFFLYYLRYFHPDKVNIDETSFQMNEITLKIIDHNVDIKTIYFTNNKKQYIKLNEMDYTIIDE